MKSIILVRHGKSSWEHDVTDQDRPLKSRGKSDAKLVANQFKNHIIKLDKIVSSPANRAYSTCKIFAESLNFDLSDVEIVDKLYDFGGENVISVIKSIDNTYNTVMIFGHNHAFTSISNIFGDTYIDNLPTSGLVKIDLDIDHWQKLKKGKTDLLIIPKELR